MSADENGVVEAEEAVIGGILVHSRKLGEVTKLLIADDFFHPALRVIYEAMIELDSSSKPIDALTVVEQMRAMETFDKLRAFNGVDYLTVLMSNVVTVENIGYHAGRIAAAARARRYSESLRQASAVARDGADDESIERARRIVDGATDCLRARGDGDIASFAMLLQSACDRMIARLDGTERPVPLPWANLAEALHGGLWSGVLPLVGNPGGGKSQFGLQMVLHAVSNGVPSLYVGLELGPLDLSARMLGLIAAQTGEHDLWWSNLFYGKDSRLPKLIEGFVPRLARLPIYHEFAGAYGWSADRLLTRIRKIRRMHPRGPLLVVVDYLQVIGSPLGERLELRERIARAAYAARDAARDYDVSVVLLSSTARENYRHLSGEIVGKESDPQFGEGDPARFLGLGKESGEIDFSADNVLVLGCNPRGNKNARIVGIAKRRAGIGDDWLRLDFDGSVFTDNREEDYVIARG